MTKTPAFNIVIVYETLAAAIRVKEMSDRLATDLRPACKLNCEFWRFDLLVHPSFCTKAATEASQADMIIIAARGDSELMAVKQWFETWLPQKRTAHSALVALLDEEKTVPGEPPALCNYLQQIAALGNMDFFCQAGGWRPAELQYVVETVHREPGIPVTALLDKTSHRDSSYRGWGINE